jgi:hypothetical protein
MEPLHHELVPADVFPNGESGGACQLRGVVRDFGGVVCELRQLQQ